MNRQRKEWMKEHLDKLETNEHIQILSIVKRHTQNMTITPTGVFVSTEHLTDDCLREMETYILFCLDQRQRMDTDMKTRKSYERMVQ
jgi:hypothetical protein